MLSENIRRGLHFNFPAGISPNLGVSHYIEMMGTGETYIPFRAGGLEPFLPTFAGTIFYKNDQDVQWQ